VRLLTANTFTGGLIFKGNNAAAYVRVDQLTSLGPAANATVTFGPGAAGKLLLNLPTAGGGIVGLVGLNTDASNPGTPLIDTASASGGPILTVSNTTDNTFAGIIANSGTKLSLTKAGTGTLTLSGDNSYTSPTIINGGMLVAGHGNALGLIGAGTGTITVNTNGTLGVAAGVTFARAVTFNAGSGLGGSGTFVTNAALRLPANFRLTPGLSTNATGTLTVDTGNNALIATNNTRLEIDFKADATADQLVVAGTGSLNLGTTTTNGTLVLRGAIKSGRYVVASASSGVTGQFLTVDKTGLDTTTVRVSYPGDGTVVVTKAAPGTTVMFR
jgi:autotransporter-associated beta strand protein